MVSGGNTASSSSSSSTASNRENEHIRSPSFFPSEASWRVIFLSARNRSGWPNGNSDSFGFGLALDGLVPEAGFVAGLGVEETSVAEET